MDVSSMFAFLITAVVLVMMIKMIFTPVKHISADGKGEPSLKLIRKRRFPLIRFKFDKKTWRISFSITQRREKFQLFADDGER